MARRATKREPVETQGEPQEPAGALRVTVKRGTPNYELLTKVRQQIDLANSAVKSANLQAEAATQRCVNARLGLQSAEREAIRIAELIASSEGIVVPSGATLDVESKAGDQVLVFAVPS